MKFFILLFAAALSASQPAPKPGSVEGLVINSATKTPVSKATVTLHNTAKGFAYAAVADGSGRFKFPSVEPGANYTITADAPGFTQEPARHARPFTVCGRSESHRHHRITATRRRCLGQGDRRRWRSRFPRPCPVADIRL